MCCIYSFSCWTGILSPRPKYSPLVSQATSQKEISQPPWHYLTTAISTKRGGMYIYLKRRIAIGTAASYGHLRSWYRLTNANLIMNSERRTIGGLKACIDFRLSRSPFSHVKIYAPFPITPSDLGHVKRHKVFERVSTIEQASKFRWSRPLQRRISDKRQIPYGKSCNRFFKVAGTDIRQCRYPTS